MALIKCPECGKEVSDLAESCPYCGYNLGGEANSAGAMNDKVVIAARNREASTKDNQTMGIIMLVIGAVLITMLIGIVFLIIGIVMLMKKPADLEVKHDCAYYSPKHRKVIFYNEQDEEIIVDPEQVVSINRKGDKLFASLLFSNVVNSHCIGTCSEQEVERCKAYIVDLKIQNKKNGKPQQPKEQPQEVVEAQPVEEQPQEQEEIKPAEEEIKPAEEQPVEDIKPDEDDIKPAE